MHYSDIFKEKGKRNISLVLPQTVLWLTKFSAPRLTIVVDVVGSREYVHKLEKE
jgi:hypothetical protein